MIARADYSTHLRVESMWEYLDGEGDASTAGKVAAHLLDCPDCRRRYASERRFLAAVARSRGPAGNLELLSARVHAALAASGVGHPSQLS